MVLWAWIKPKKHAAVNISKFKQQKSPEKQKLNISRSALFYMKTRVCFKYFVNDSRSEMFFSLIFEKWNNKG